jgi:calmodulin
MKSLGLNPTKAEIEDMINEVDIDHTGTVDLEGTVILLFSRTPTRQLTSHPPKEFIKMMTASPSKHFRQEMLQAFKVFDMDNGGTISSAEIYRVMSSIGQQVSDEELKCIIEEVDKNGDGTIDCERSHDYVVFWRDDESW